jgi:integrase
MLTDVGIRALKPLDRPYKKADGGGLSVLVQPDGKKFWRLAYRFEGRQKTLSGGRYPTVGLRAARAWRDASKTLLARGYDPSAHRQGDARLLKTPVRNTFAEVAREWMEARRLGWSPRYASLVIGRFEADVFPVVGEMEISAITPRHMLEAIRQIEARGAVEMAHRVRAHVSEVFRFAIPDGRCESDPCRDLVPALARPRPVQHRARVSAEELPGFFARLNEDSGSRLSHLALRWTMLTMVRTQETRFAEWEEFEDLDGREPLWRIPAARMKMRSEHLVPLSRQALAVLRELHGLNTHRQSGDRRFGRYVFPWMGSTSCVISENRMLDIMYRLGLRGKATVHGFRGLASTVLNESGRFEPDWIEYQLAHQPGGVRAAYNAACYLRHRRPMMQWWADYLEEAETRGACPSEGVRSEHASAQSHLTRRVIPWDRDYEPHAASMA